MVLSLYQHSREIHSEMSSQNMPDIELLVFGLEFGRNYESEIYKVPKGAIVRFTLGPSLYGHKVALFINSPTSPQVTFKRNCYRPLKWEHHFADYADEGNAYSDCMFPSSGTFRFYFTVDGSSEENGSGFILVDPVLILQGKALPLDGIQCQTVLSKCLGPLHTWEDKIAVAVVSGYNMIHFTPIQALGDSNSAYSLKDHMALNDAFTAHNTSKPTFEDIKKFLEVMENKHSMLSLTDIVLNHTANETFWLREHPECSFNARNSPHLRPAMLLDQELFLLSMRAMRGEMVDAGIPPSITKEEHLEAVRRQIIAVILPRLRLHEFYICDIDKLVKEFEATPVSTVTCPRESLKMRYNYTRYGTACDFVQARKVFHSAGDFRHFLVQFNSRECHLTEEHLRNATENVIKGLRYHKIDEWGPRQHNITKDDLLVVRYFFPNHGSLTDEMTSAEMEITFGDERGAYIMAHNGWVMGDDPLRNFASEGSMVYLRRELIAWGDSCKLRYGEKPADCPFLWNYMEKYVKKSAELFHGLRLDNCHSTPIHVAEYLLDSARSVRGDLYVIAELFTSSEAVDNLFVNRLGINSLIREALQAHDSHELGRLVHRFGGLPVGSFFHAKGVAPLMPSVAHAILVDMTHDNPSPFEKRSVYDFLPSAALVSMASCASGSSRGYDELVPHHIHVVKENREFAGLRQLSPSTGIIEAKRLLNEMHHRLAIDGFVEVYVDQLDYNTVAVTRRCPHNDNSVVLVARTAFQCPADPEEAPYLKPLRIAGKIDDVILEARMVRALLSTEPFVKDSKRINGLTDFKLILKSNFPTSESSVVDIRDIDSENCEVNFVNFKPGSVIAFRISVGPASRSSMETARGLLRPFGYFKNPVQVPNGVTEIIEALDLGDINRILFRCDQEERSDGFGFSAYNLAQVGPMIYCGFQVNLPIVTIQWLQEKIHIAGFRAYWFPIRSFRFAQPFHQIVGTLVAEDRLLDSMLRRNRLVIRDTSGRYRDIQSLAGLPACGRSLNLGERQELIYEFLSQCLDVRADRVPGINWPVEASTPVLSALKGYQPDVIPLHDYRDLQKLRVMSLLAFIRPRNDLGHPLCSNIREGDWLMDYLISRLRPHKSCVRFQNLLQQMFEPVRGVPHYLKPCYFDAVVTALFTQLLDASWKKMSRFVSCGSNFVRELSLASVILTGFVYDSPLPPLSERLTPSAPLKIDVHSQMLIQQCPTLAAGLPHFATGYMRNWGRDTFISLRGLLILTGRFAEARSIILGFAGALRHGLIPNLLDRGTNSRYNCRDAVWFWLESIKHYVLTVPNGQSILNDVVSRLYPDDDSEAETPDAVVMPLSEVMQEALQRHWTGISFRERNAGTRIDSDMKDSGFNVTAGVHYDTGFVYGGNIHNCGTWMDKMGSVPGVNQGEPASPRDGSAVELVGLCKSTVSWLHEAYDNGIYPYNGVQNKDGTLTSFVEWASRIKSHFEPHFWVPEEGAGPQDLRPDLINRRGIYKDTLGSGLPWADYQFRPNFTIAMVVAPELFNRAHAQKALTNAENLLKGPLGMKTLDPGDMTYNGDYDNSDASAGFNYHRGPEWLWPMGYFLRAQLLFADDVELARQTARRSVQHHWRALQESPWRGLAELTNHDGAPCPHSCPIQAWSHGCLLELLHQLYHNA
ncbi:glycogen debranching enzyme-like [Tropilaelaps mercedesae]|uniref:Glycogen debranching enzyme-like n=1 Tax=Tropilaelaps mercedesae TaxID=418985 RepID=A0A1V9X4B6_9ACAR|nr:glycogen debranching enzyme-like [Tropilaelaps mercedesae]